MPAHAGEHGDQCRQLHHSSGHDLSGRSGHTRLPGYVRGRKGTIFARHGGHVFPDASARGEQKAEHLYTISFAASELWPEAMDRRDRVFVDLWEGYLERS
ncbi:SH3-like domain-containing protein [Mesorhizobium sp.]|uniref:SH3-like domain-containing protein n=1 Tax=Mesorhizobium sp. TaxID=1871066 RepID=UPI0034260653